MLFIGRLLIVFFTIAISLGMIAIGQTSAVDLTYNAAPSLPLLPAGTDQSSVRQAIQSDGKILVWSDSIAIVVQGVAKGSLARLNSDGTLDNSFSYCHCVITSFVNAAPLPDGKILVAGSTGLVWKVIRLNNDGSLDPTFNFTAAGTGAQFSYATIAAVQPDGRFFVGHTGYQFGFSQLDLFHINADGSSNSSFSGILIGSGSPNFSSIGDIELLSDGRFYVATNTFGPVSTTTTLKRYLATGAVDPTWQIPNFASSVGFQAPAIRGLDAQTDGSLLVSGNFDSVNGVSKTDLVRLQALGNVDLGFTAPAVFGTFGSGWGVEVLSSGKILFSATTLGPPLSGRDERLYRANSDGTLDGTYSMDASIATIRNPWVLDASERAVFAAGNGLVRLQVNGPLDMAFSPNIGRYGQVHALARQSDGKVIAAGEFTAFNGVSATRLARTNSDGTSDGTYNTGTGFDVVPSRIALQSDGKLLVIGTFTSYNGTSVPGIVRLNTDGSIDSSFSVTLNAGGQILAIEPLSDGRVYIGGNFSTVNGTARPGLARLQSNGALDTGFNAFIGGSPSITAVVVQPDTKVLIGGSFAGVAGFNRSNFARVDSTGALDQPFNPANTVAGRIYLAGGGKIVTTEFGVVPSQSVLRRNSDGSLDSSFNSPSFSDSVLESIVVGSDGSMIVGGGFNTVGTASRRGIVRLTPTGSLDQLFLPNSCDGRVRAIIDGGTEKVLIGGDFTRVETTIRAGIARLNVTPFRKVTPFDFDGDGRADITVYRPSTFYWYQLLGPNYQFAWSYFGAAGDILTPADFDGDGKTDISIFRPSSGIWVYASSASSGTQSVTTWGQSGDIPLPSDFNGDGKADFIVYRPSTNFWYRYANGVGTMSFVNFGAVNDKPVIGDFDGDGKSDPAVFRPSTGEWFYASSLNGGQHLRAAQWGLSTDQLVPADYDGDGKTDPAIYRNGLWAIYNSSNGSFTILTFGLASDKPVAADYDGDGKADVAVYRPSDGTWYLLRSTSGFQAVTFGASTDAPAPNAFVR